MSLDPAQPIEVADALRKYLSGHLSKDVEFADPPAAIGRGFDTHIYAFELRSGSIEASWARPLVLRLYTTTGQGEKAEREGTIQRFATARGYPALDPLVVERCAQVFELPLMIMERADGVPMLEKIGMNPRAVRHQFAAMARAHVALHRLPVDDCPLPSHGPLVDRKLAELRRRADRTASKELSASVVWLETNKHQVMTEERSLCHGDFHPLNILVGDEGNLTVLDWSDAAVGDRHFDVGRTLALFEFAWIAAGNSVERVVLRFARRFLASSYLEPYRRELPLDAERLRYWQAFHAAQAWLQLIELDDPANAHMSGAREDSVARLPEGLVLHLRRYFRKTSGSE